MSWLLLMFFSPLELIIWYGFILTWLLISIRDWWHPQSMVCRWSFPLFAPTSDAAAWPNDKHGRGQTKGRPAQISLMIAIAWLDIGYNSQCWKLRAILWWCDTIFASSSSTSNIRPNYSHGRSLATSSVSFHIFMILRNSIKTYCFDHTAIR